MPHCCKSYDDVQIQLTAETQLGNVALRFALTERQFAIVMQSRIDYKANIFLLEELDGNYLDQREFKCYFGIYL